MGRSKTETEFDKIRGEVIARKFHPVYLLQGPESFFIDRLADLFFEQVLSEAEKGFNFTLHYGQDIDSIALIAAARRYPMMAEYQLIVVREAQNLEMTDKLIPYLDNPVPSTILVFCHKNGKMNKTTRVWKAFSKHRVFDSEMLKENQVGTWIEQILHEKKLGISPQNLELLKSSLDNNLSYVSNEIDKLTAGLEPGSEISGPSIEQKIGVNHQYNVFELQKALSQKNLLKAIEIGEYFSANFRNHPFPMILVNVFNFFSKIMVLQSQPSGTPESLASMIGVMPFFMSDYTLAARNYTPQKLQSVFGILNEFDLKFKGVDSGKIPERDLYREFIVKLIR